MSTTLAYAPYRYRRVQMNTASLNYAPTKGWVCSSLKGYSLNCITFRTAPDVSIGYGKFLTAVINFIIMAFVIFLIVKLVNKIMAIGKKPEEPAEPTTKICPFCQSEISIKATKCPHCTSDIPAETETKE